MKISQTGSGAPASRRRNVGNSSEPDSASSFKTHVQGEQVATPSGVTASSPLTALSTILAVQETPDSTSERRRAILQGENLLDELAALQMCIIEGSLSEDMLKGVTKLLSRPRPDVDDGELNQVLDEIEVRAAVELAKLEKDVGLEREEL